MTAPDVVSAVRARVAAALDAAGLAPGARIGVACSGGPDSMALADAAIAALGADRVALLHVDHGLRPDSAADAALVVGFGRDRGAACRVAAVDVDAAGGSLEAAARRARYAALAALADADDLALVLTAHTARDQAETVLMRIVRGTGPAGLAGIPPRRGRYLRPLLATTRAEIDAYVAACGLPVAQDPTNDDPRFFRNRVRAGLMPALAAENPRIEAALCRLAAAAREDRAAIAAAARALAAAAAIADAPPGTIAFAAAPLTAGCLTVPSAATPMCQSTADCNAAAGEVCEEGVCWGNPPPGPFAATLVPPADATGVTATEISSLAIPSDGWLGPLTLDAPVTISGRVDAFCALPASCDGLSIAATVTVTRPSRIPGGPPFRAVVTAKDGVAGRSDSFSLQVPRTQDGDPPYVITVRPVDRSSQTATADGTAPAESVPPARMTAVASTSLSIDVVLGSATPPTITGLVTDELGHPLPDYRVVALGRWDTSSALGEVSTVDYSTDGSFTLALADGVAGPVELVARPYDADAVAPELHVGNVTPGGTPHTLAQPHDLGNPLPVTVNVVGQTGSGKVAGVAGAQVAITATVTSLVPTAHATTVFDAAGTTDQNGNIVLNVLDGTALGTSYTLRIIPPAGSSLGVVYDQPLALDQAALGPVMIHLPSRLALHGVVLDAEGSPVSNVSVTARPSLRFTWNLDPTSQQFLAQIPAATAVTPASGDFVVWLDPALAGVWGRYDLVFDPPTGSSAPTWTLADVELPRVASATSYSVDNVPLPDVAHVHGQLVDPAGNAVDSAELRVYQVVTDPSLCSQVQNPPANCVIPARLQGQGTSDDTGTVRLTLPRP